MRRLTLVLLTAFIVVPACNCGGVNSEDEARIAYLGLDQVVVRGLALGFDGFNAADSANIPTQSADGDESGDITVAGQVDQGNSDNKGMRLDVTLSEYSDGTIDDPETDEEEELAITYDTADAGPMRLEMNLRDIPDGTITGTFAGTVRMEGDLQGDLDVDLAFDGLIESDGSGGTQREEGTTEVTGTATSPSGEYEIDTTI
jgi:hypothetical protein